MTYVTYAKCDKCGRVEEDPWPPLIPIIVEAGERGEEGHSVRRGDFCDRCAPGILEAIVKVIGVIPLTLGRPGGTAFLTTEQEEKEARQR